MVGGGTSLLTMMTNAMQEMLDMNWQMDFVINLSGTDYLIKKPEDLKKYLSKNMGLNFVFYVEGDEESKNSKKGEKILIIECLIFDMCPHGLPKEARPVLKPKF